MTKRGRKSIGTLTMRALFWLSLMTAGVVCMLIATSCAKYAKSPTLISSGASRGRVAGLPMASAGVRASMEEFPGSGPSLDEEVWVIARDESARRLDEDEGPGSGQMMGRASERGEVVPLPLRHTDVRAAIHAHVASVTVVQKFENPYDDKIEAVYVFPLPQNAAVNGFVMTMGERRIRGIIRERREAEAIYQEARGQGYVASLLTQERPNVFTQSVANLEPGKEVDVVITYFHTLAYDDGWYEWVFPMVVGPRFNPPGWTSGVGAVGRGSVGGSGQSAEVAYLKPRERSGHDVSLALEVEAGVAIEEFSCRSHVVHFDQPAPERLVVSLHPNDRIPNRDFVLRYRVAGEQMKSSLLTQRDERGDFFSLVLYPPRDLARLERGALELVFVLDCSGSMSGRPLQQAKSAVRRALQQLEPRDTFQIIRFSDQATQLGDTPVRATAKNVADGLRYLERLRSEGGTMMLTGIKAALDFPHDPERLRYVCFLTDGYIGNEVEILRAVERRLGESRILSFGVGSAVNRYLLENLARLGKGAVAYLGPNDSSTDVMDAFIERIGHPALTDVRIDWGTWKVEGVYPSRISDVFVGRPVILTGRFKGASGATVRVEGRAGDRRLSWDLKARERASVTDVSALASVWARMKIANLEDRFVVGGDSEVVEQIREVALDYNLMSAYTAFVAVDSSRRTGGGQGTTVPVAVPVPDGVKYRTTVSE